MNKRLYLFFLFAIAILLFALERDLMFSDDIVGRGIVSIAFIVGSLLLLSIIAVLLSKQPVMINRLSRRFSYLWLYICLYFIINSLDYSTGSRNLYGLIPLPLFMLYFGSITSRYFKSDNVIIWTITIVVLLLAYYYLNNYYKNELFIVENTSSGAYAILYLLPFLLCHKKVVFQISSILLTLLIIMLSLKRGGFLALLAAVVVFLLITQIGIKKQRFNIKRLLLLIVLPLGLYALILYLNESVLEGLLFSRFENDETGSGRTYIYQQYWMLLWDSSPSQLIIGHGWMGSIRDSGIEFTCHNDFLEAIIDFGIIGFLFYILLYIELIKFCKRMVQNNNIYAPAMGASIALFFVNSMVSHILIYPKFLVLFTFFWGFMVSTTRSVTNLKQE